MPFVFNWQDAEHSIIRIDSSGEVNWDEFTKAADQIVEAIGQSDHRVDLIFNNQTSVPKGNPLPHIRAANRRLAKFGDRFGLVITVGPRNISSVIKMMVDIMIRVYKLEQNHLGEDCRTMEDALAQIARSRAKAKAAKAGNSA